MSQEWKHSISFLGYRPGFPVAMLTGDSQPDDDANMHKDTEKSCKGEVEDTSDGTGVPGSSHPKYW